MSEPFENECCSDMIAAKKDIAELKSDRDEFKAFMQEMREAMTYRLPLWATFTISGLSGLVGWLLASK